MASLICNMDDDCEKLLVCKMDLDCVKTLQFDTEVIFSLVFMLYFRLVYILILSQRFSPFSYTSKNCYLL